MLRDLPRSPDGRAEFERWYEDTYGLTDDWPAFWKEVDRLQALDRLLEVLARGLVELYLLPITWGSAVARVFWPRFSRGHADPDSGYHPKIKE